MAGTNPGQVQAFGLRLWRDRHIDVHGLILVWGSVLHWGLYCFYEGIKIQNVHTKMKVALRPLGAASRPLPLKRARASCVCPALDDARFSILPAMLAASLLMPWNAVAQDMEAVFASNCAGNATGTTSHAM